MQHSSADTALILSVLKTVLPMECGIVGESNLENIAAGKTDILPIGGGSKFPVTKIVSLVVSAASFASSVVTIIKVLKKEEKTSPADLVVKVENTIKVNEGLTSQTKLEICEQLLKELNKEK